MFIYPQLLISLSKKLLVRRETGIWRSLNPSGVNEVQMPSLALANSWLGVDELFTTWVFCRFNHTISDKCFFCKTLIMIHCNIVYPKKIGTT